MNPDNQINNENILGISIIGKVHDSLYESNRSTGVTDTILVGATYAFNLLMLALISMSLKNSAIYFVFIISLILINVLILFTFGNSLNIRKKIHSKQKMLYEDQKLLKYFDDTILTNYIRRYYIWITLDVLLGLMVLSVAILMKYLQN